jgi:uncharacterized membrane protein
VTPSAARADAVGGSSAADAPTLVASGDVIRIPAASVTKTATFFKVEAGGTLVPFFAVRDAMGAAVVALDACNVCAHARRGYGQRGNEMVCNNCGMTFPVDSLAKMGGEGGCHPITVASRVDGDSVVVDRASLAAGARWFS